ncbi:protein NO VEIN domain-containing protein [Nocardia iowensis]|uniref:DUF3883 domain-containing protein n=1 Tax=Nocardia iowensis TaxID=204891 RepID=A0ABX8RY02_NOCIO|nr:DUF3883 domain-containing protein [Nocardia iowensis]QXN94555.1 DUF3883 domain-containing protein [Nocardia iowensis]
MGSLEADIALHVESMRVGVESRKRARNYEIGNVHAIRYQRDAIPPDEVLLSDLERMVLLLSRVYESAEELRAGALVDSIGSALVPAAARGWQRRVQDSRIRRAIEDYSMEFVAGSLPRSEWHVQDVSRYRPYDLLCRRLSDDLELHVEVKGTASSGCQVFLTREEVKHASSFGGSVLAIVHGIEVTATEDGVLCTGGELYVLDSWTPADEDLEVVQYTYQVPPRQAIASGGTVIAHQPWQIDTAMLRPIFYCYTTPSAQPTIPTRNATASPGRMKLHPSLMRYGPAGPWLPILNTTPEAPAEVSAAA